MCNNIENLWDGKVEVLMKNRRTCLSNLFIFHLFFKPQFFVTFLCLREGFDNNWKQILLVGDVVIVTVDFRFSSL